MAWCSVWWVVAAALVRVGSAPSACRSLGWSCRGCSAGCEAGVARAELVEAGEGAREFADSVCVDAECEDVAVGECGERAQRPVVGCTEGDDLVGDLAAVEHFGEVACD